MSGMDDRSTTLLRSAAGDLKARVTRGGFSLTAGNGAEQTFRLIRNMILVRLLAPQAFGAMAIILAVNAFFEAFTGIGIKEAVIQNPEAEERTFLNGVWWISFGRALVLYACTFLATPLILVFYRLPGLAPMMRVAFLTILFQGLTSPRSYIAAKRMDFRRYTLIQQGGSILGIAVAILLALRMRSIWALILGFCLEEFCRMVLSYILCPFLPGLQLRREHLQSLLRFIRGMFGLPLLTFVFNRCDMFVIGRLCTKEELGIYSMAVSFASLPSLLTAKVVQPLLLPTMSEMQSDSGRIGRTLLGTHAAFVTAGMPIVVFVCLFGGTLLRLFYTSTYAAAAVPFILRFATIMLGCFSVPIVTAYLALGRPELHRRFTLIRAALAVALMVPAVRLFGLTGAAAAGLLSMLVGYVLQIARFRRVLEVDIRGYLLQYGYGFLLGAPLLPVCALTSVVFHAPPLVSMAAGAMVLLPVGLLAVRRMRAGARPAGGVA